MPLPESHLDALQESVAAHETRIAQLREAIRHAEEEIAMHELLVALARNDALLDAVGQVYEGADEEGGISIADDPAGYCAQHGITVPSGVTIHRREANRPDGLRGRVQFWNCDVEVSWDRESRFRTKPVMAGMRMDLTPILYPGQERNTS